MILSLFDRIPSPALMLAAGLMGPSASFMVLLDASSWPMLYGSVGSFGMVTAFLVGFLLLGHGQGLCWRALLLDGARCRALLPVLISRLSYPLNVLAGLRIRCVVAG